MCPEKQWKPVKARVGVLSSWDSGLTVPFPPQNSVVRVNFSVAATTQDPAGRDGHHFSPCAVPYSWMTISWLAPFFKFLVTVSLHLLSAHGLASHLYYWTVRNNQKGTCMYDLNPFSPYMLSSFYCHIWVYFLQLLPTPLGKKKTHKKPENNLPFLYKKKIYLFSHTFFTSNI